jgi:hypothetical protein
MLEIERKFVALGWIPMKTGHGDGPRHLARRCEQEMGQNSQVSQRTVRSPFRRFIKRKTIGSM